ncbi:clathrin interactor 1-like isoform X2 [Dreissena polymorpha]|uniref:ENTH domain-containing protein n=1 Tax=Dreissena polymorpha TaxID=45954 RepID=A0A9D4EZY4_DREPO|nr:clathrin interactor 1-like isoform X2 [Dreissena polymorpha]KAH3789297.1 hypothetical protein DPMN_167472 [Dreissena polymorpha]
MHKIREITEKVTNVVMNYSEVETKVREATNDDAWGPHGSICSEIAQYTFTYEHFPEVMGMLWKRMFHENKKSWRRTYKSLTLLMYLIRNGSERVVTGAREHLYDLRGLENYTFTDEHGKDQGLNVRHKVKEIVELIQNDDKLRDERKKAKKNKDKFTGMSGDLASSRSSYSDRYDEAPRKNTESHLGEIDDWNDGKKSVVDEAVDKGKDIWNRIRGIAGPDETVDYSGNADKRGHDVIGFSDEVDNNQRNNDDDFDFKDNIEEYTRHEKTETTKTEKITSAKRRTPAKIDLGAAASQLGKDSDTKSVSSSASKSTIDTGPSLIDMGLASGSGSNSVADFADFQSAGNEFNPRGQKVDDFADFSGASFPSPTHQQQNGGFADFSSLSSSQTQQKTNASNSSDLFDVFSSGNAPMQSTVPIHNMYHTNNMASMNNQGFMGNMASPNMGMMGNQPGMMSSQVGMMSSQPNMMPSNAAMMGHSNMMSSQPKMMFSQPQMMSGQPQMMSSQPQMMSSQPQMMSPNMMGMQQPMGQPMMPQQGMMGNMGMMGNQPTSAPGMMGMMQPNQAMQQNQNAGKNTWATDAGKVNISLDALSPAGKFQQQNKPSMNQLSGQKPGMAPAAGQPMMGNLMTGMANMNMAGQPQMMSGGMAMGMHNMGAMGMQGTMMSPGGGAVRMQATVNMQNTMVGASSFQKRTDNAFSAFGSMK